jgi:hypothetical protein
MSFGNSTLPWCGWCAGREVWKLITHPFQALTLVNFQFVMKFALSYGTHRPGFVPELIGSKVTMAKQSGERKLPCSGNYPVLA